MNIIKFSPLRTYMDRSKSNEFEGFWNEVNDIFQSFSDSGHPDTMKSIGFIPAIDVKETDKCIVVQAELPGMQESDIDVSIKDGNLLLEGEKKSESKIENENYVRVERNFGRFQRAVTIPSDVDTSKIEAVYKNGILTVTLPKIISENKEHKIKIKSA